MESKPRVNKNVPGWALRMDGGVSDAPTINERINGIRHPWLSAEFSKEMFKKLSSSAPTDEVVLTDNLLDYTERLFKTLNYNKDGMIPMDIFYEGTVPIRDIFLDFRSVNKATDGRNPKIRFLFLQKDIEDFKNGVLGFGTFERISEYVDLSANDPIGYAVLYTKQDLSCGYAVPIIPVIDPEDDSRCLKVSSFVSAFGGLEREAKGLDNDAYERLSYVVESSLWIWYAVQTCLMNPVIIERVEAERRTAGESGNSAVRKKYRRVAHTNIRNLKVVSMDGSMFVPTPRHRDGFNRKCLAWYVQGHFRKTKSGAKTWVRPCWKGAERDMHRQAETRQRTIMQAEEVVQCRS